MPPPEPLPSDPDVIRPKRAAPAEIVRPTRAEVSLQALRDNLRTLRRYAGPAAVWAVLKADGYGHGAPAVARTLERAGADGFCVALLEEAIELRDAGIIKPILVMGGYYASAYAELAARHLTPVIYDLRQVEAIARLVRSGAIAAPVDAHLKIDTGMARLGVTLRELDAFAARLGKFPEVKISGLMTHLACADALTSEETAEQMARFEEATILLARYGVSPKIRHAANSAALLRSQARLDFVRPGVAMFGISPPLPAGAVDTPLTSALKQVMRVRTEIVALRSIAPGSAAGYGATWHAPKESVIATIAMGYADGLSRALSNRGEVLVRGKRAPIVGTVSMDMTMVDVTAIDGASIGDEVVVLGAQDGPLGSGFLGADEIARHCDTIPWEVMCAISRRVPRFYRES